MYVASKSSRKLTDDRDLHKYNITYYPRKFKEFVDDNLNYLHEARFLSFPADWEQYHSQLPQKAQPYRINYPLDKLGVHCMNKRLLAKIHDMSFVEMSPSMFSDKNLRRSSVKYTVKTNERIADEVWFVAG